MTISCDAYREERGEENESYGEAAMLFLWSSDARSLVKHGVEMVYIYRTENICAKPRASEL